MGATTGYMTPAFSLTVRCHQCSRHYASCNLIPYPGGVRVCLKCHENHQQQVQKLAWNPTLECGSCQLSLAALSERQGGGNVRMMAHWRDGTYQLLCLRCSDNYERKRSDLYGETQYAAQKGLFK